MRIVFMGTPQAAAVSLHGLIEGGHEIAAVYTQPDRPSGRGNKLSASPVKQIALSRGLEVQQPTKLKIDETIDTFRSHQADAAVVVAYGRILPPAYLDAFPYGAINVHFSLLPKYRGAAPVNWAIVNGENETGVTTMKMDAGLDTGDILLQRSTAIGTRENAVDLLNRLATLGADLISETLLTIDRLVAISQDDSAATFAPIMNKADGLIDWQRSATELDRRVRGFQPFPTSYTFHTGLRWTIWNVEAKKGPHEEAPGTILATGNNELTIGCGQDSSLSITEIQPEGKKRMPIRDFLNGTNVRIGEILGSRNNATDMVNRPS
jgi:methionyl-tRNA formyltransferase